MTVNEKSPVEQVEAAREASTTEPIFKTEGFVRAADD